MVGPIFANKTIIGARRLLFPCRGKGRDFQAGGGFFWHPGPPVGQPDCHEGGGLVQRHGQSLGDRLPPRLEHRRGEVKLHRPLERHRGIER